MLVQAKNILLLCSSPLLSLRISMHLDLMDGVTLHGFRGIEGALLDKETDVDLVIAVSKLGDFDDTARVQQIRREWPSAKIVLITELVLPGQKIYSRKLVNGVVYLFWYFQTKMEAKELIEQELVPDLMIERKESLRKVKLKAPSPINPLDRLKPAIVVIASSTGGFAALRKMVGSLPDTFRAPIVIAQHIPKGFDSTLQRSLAGLSHMTVELAADGPIQNRHIYIAPFDYHVEVLQGESGLMMSLNQSAPVHSLRPAADPLFYSASKVKGHRVVAAILTGMGSDGTRGGIELKAMGATVICQDEASSSVWGMARTAVDAGICDKQVPLNSLSQALFELTK